MAFGAGGGSPDEVQGAINVTPLVDVCLVLLIIFMVVTPMLQQGVDVLLPAGPHAERKPGEEGDLLLSVKADGTIFVGQHWIPDRDLAGYLQGEYSKNPARGVMLKADKRVPFSSVRTVMRAANQAQFTQVAVMTENQQAGQQMAEGKE